MRELRRGQIKKIIDRGMELAADVVMRDRMSLEEIYKLTEAIKGAELTTREKKIIAGIVTRNYPRKYEEEKKRLTILIV